ncbi:hypothetical protein T08_4335 [Trichinella sp. T8]|nr:hypothetical protein T08_4335 [Trichinella sp. T8]
MAECIQYVAYNFDPAASLKIEKYALQGNRQLITLDRIVFPFPPLYSTDVKDRFLPTKHWPCSCLERIHRHRLLSQNSGKRHLSSQGASIVSGTENQELKTATVNETKIEMHTLDTLAKTGLRVVFQHIISVVTLTLSKHTGYAEAGAICVRVTRFAHRTRTLEAERNKEKTVEIHNYRENKENLPWQGAKNAQLNSTADASKTSKTLKSNNMLLSTANSIANYKEKEKYREKERNREMKPLRSPRRPSLQLLS